MKFDQNLIFVKGAKGKKDRITLLSEKLKIKLKEYIAAFKPDYWLFEGQLVVQPVGFSKKFFSLFLI